jgi:hypothetical protein
VGQELQTFRRDRLAALVAQAIGAVLKLLKCVLYFLEEPPQVSFSGKPLVALYDESGLVSGRSSPAGSLVRWALLTARVVVEVAEFLLDTRLLLEQSLPEGLSYVFLHRKPPWSTTRDLVSCHSIKQRGRGREVGSRSRLVVTAAEDLWKRSEAASKVFDSRPSGDENVSYPARSAQEQSRSLRTASRSSDIASRRNTSVGASSGQ